MAPNDTIMQQLKCNYLTTDVMHFSGLPEGFLRKAGKEGVSFVESSGLRVTIVTYLHSVLHIALKVWS